MWRENLIEFKKRKGVKIKDIAEGTNLPERTVSRIFSGETPNPTIANIIPIAGFLGVSLDEIFADTTARIGSEHLSELQAELKLALSENSNLKEMVSEQASEIALLKKELMHKDELLAVHNYYNKIKTNN